MKSVIVKYWIADYSGQIDLTVNEDDEQETIIAMAKTKLKRMSGSSLPLGQETFEIAEA